jgi:hypothetical protein
MEEIVTTYISVNYTNDVTRQSPKYPLLATVAEIMTRYIWIAPVIIGVPGNILAILVANRKHNRALSSCIYMKAMAVADTSELVTQAIGFPIMHSQGGKTVVHRDSLFR